MEPLGTIYTLHEAAERLRMTPRMVCKIARAHGLCARAGRDYLFSESDIAGIWNAQREATKVTPGTVKGAEQQSFPSQAYANLIMHAKSKKRR